MVNCHAQEVFEALLAKMPKEEGGDASDEEGAEEGTPADSPDGDQAAGASMLPCLKMAYMLVSSLLEVPAPHQCSHVSR